MNRQATSHHKNHAAVRTAKHGMAKKRHSLKASDDSEMDVAPEIRRAMVAEAAYYHAEKRGFTPGDELADWLQAEAEIEALLGHITQQ